MSTGGKTFNSAWENWDVTREKLTVFLFYDHSSVDTSGYQIGEGFSPSPKDSPPPAGCPPAHLSSDTISQRWHQLPRVKGPVPRN